MYVGYELNVSDGMTAEAYPFEHEFYRKYRLVLSMRFKVLTVLCMILRLSHQGLSSGSNSFV